MCKRINGKRLQRQIRRGMQVVLLALFHRIKCFCLAAEVIIISIFIFTLYIYLSTMVPEIEEYSIDENVWTIVVIKNGV